MIYLKVDVLIISNVVVDLVVVMRLSMNLFLLNPPLVEVTMMFLFKIKMSIYLPHCFFEQNIKLFSLYLIMPPVTITRFLYHLSQS